MSMMMHTPAIKALMDSLREIYVRFPKAKPNDLVGIDMTMRQATTILMDLEALAFKPQRPLTYDEDANGAFIPPGLRDIYYLAEMRK